MLALTAADIEYAIARRLGPRKYTICPNVSWGLGFKHELDLCVLTKADWVWEIEIKVSAHDLKRDADKAHGHKDNRIRALFFAIPKALECLAGNIPIHAGIWVVDDNLKCTLLRKPILNKDAVKLSDRDKFRLVRLASMRLWDRKPRPDAFDDGMAKAVDNLISRGFEIFITPANLSDPTYMTIYLRKLTQDKTTWNTRTTRISRLQMIEAVFPEAVIMDALTHAAAEIDLDNLSKNL